MYVYHTLPHPKSLTQHYVPTPCHHQTITTPPHTPPSYHTITNHRTPCHRTTLPPHLQITTTKPSHRNTTWPPHHHTTTTHYCNPTTPTPSHQNTTIPTPHRRHTFDSRTRRHDSTSNWWQQETPTTAQLTGDSAPHSSLLSFCKSSFVNTQISHHHTTTISSQLHHTNTSTLPALNYTYTTTPSQHPNYTTQRPDHHHTTTTPPHPQQHSEYVQLLYDGSKVFEMRCKPTLLTAIRREA